MQRNPAQENFVPGTSRGPRKVATLLAQMDDLERGARIQELRNRLHLTQPTVAERVHVTLRAYQEWEAGGGIQWENAKRLAKALGTTADYLMSGHHSATPDLSLEPTQLDRVEARLDQLHERVTEIRVLLTRTQKDSADQAAHVEQGLQRLTTRLDEAIQSPTSQGLAPPATTRANKRRKSA